MSVLSAELTEQAAVTNWPLRILLVLATAAVIGVALFALRRGWLARGRRQGLTVPMAPQPVIEAAADLPSAEGSYIGTVLRGRLLERVVAGGTRARADVVVGDFGVLVERQGEPSLFITADAIDGLQTVPGMLQRHFGAHGLLLIDWTWQGTAVSSGFWFPDPATQGTTKRLIEQAHLEGVA